MPLAKTKPHVHSKNKIEVELGLANYTTKSELKNVTGVNILEFTKNTDLARLKLDIDKLVDIGKILILKKYQVV